MSSVIIKIACLREEKGPFTPPLLSPSQQVGSKLGGSPDNSRRMSAIGFLAFKIP